MSLTAGMDSGPIYSQLELELTKKESKQDLASRLGDLGATEISKLLSEGVPKPKEQTGQPTICPLMQRSDSILDLSKPAEQLGREVRTYLGWPGSKLDLELKDGTKLTITVTQASISDEKHEDNPLSLQTSKGHFNIEKLKLPGRNEMTTKEFLNGYRSKLRI